MQRKLRVLFLILCTITLVPIVSVSAKKPLVGIMDLELILVPHPKGLITWEGTIELDGESYDMRFYFIGPGIPRDGATGKAGHFGEIWEIYDGSPDNLILWGFDKGVTNQKKDLSHWQYRMNGNVEYAASGWEVYLGRNVHMSGIITWYGPPATPGSIAPGVFRIN
jgi:hypothetical protein